MEKLVFIFIIFCFLSCNKNKTLQDDVLYLGRMFYENSKGSDNEKFINLLIKQKSYGAAFNILDTYPERFNEGFLNKKIVECGIGAKKYELILNQREWIQDKDMGINRIIPFLDSIVFLNRHLEMYPMDYSSYNERGNNFFKLDQIIAASYDYAYAFNHQPSNKQFAFNYIYSLLHQNKATEAQAVFKNSSSPSVLNDTRINKMIALADSIISIENSNLPEHHESFKKAQMFYRFNQMKLAFKAIEKSLQREVEFSDAYAFRALMFYRSGQMGEAYNDILMAEKYSGRLNTPLSKMIKNAYHDKMKE
jgi:tetratricopeptide (TPR) repeat protein